MRINSMFFSPRSFVSQSNLAQAATSGGLLFVARGAVAQFPRRSINSRERPKDRFTTRTGGASLLLFREEAAPPCFLPRRRDECTFYASRVFDPIVSVHTRVK